ncbi:MULTISPECIES: glycoside hydrolase family 9 protein [unclassified Sphingobacterium]|uniref:glycoside hydrolase family 9 protein n=1 Tax=unclassified Sphingobacterium TaxID=2609468 RepID=UPI00257DEBDE|nr:MULTISPECIES: glycoside hydrolase family 9 protein [unclassified Sphingobacterium]
MNRFKILSTSIASLFLLQLGLAQTPKLTKDPKLNEEIWQTGILHRPLPLDTVLSLENLGWKKKVLRRYQPKGITDFKNWNQQGVGKIFLEKQHAQSSQGSIKLQVPTVRKEWAPGAPSDGDYANYGGASAMFEVGGENWEKYNRIFFRIYPDCEGGRNIHLNLHYYNNGKQKIPDEYYREGTHEINLVNREWNTCYLEIGDLPRDKITRIAFGVPGFGKDRTMGDSLNFYIEGVELQEVEQPEHMLGWQPVPNRIIYSSSGYDQQGLKTALLSDDSEKAKVFKLLRASDGTVVYEGEVTTAKTSIGSYQVLDFSAFSTPGQYLLSVGNSRTEPFSIGANIWENSVWRVLNFILCERCGHPVSEKHGSCHADIGATHEGLRLAYNGGWHDAGDLSQQSLQTGDVVFALLEMANKVKDINPALYLRLLEEAEWGLDFVLKTRLGNGFRASSVGIVIWTDGLIGNMDDMKARVHDSPFDNFLFSAYEAYGAMSVGKDPALAEKLRKVAMEDFDFALAKWKEKGYDHFPVFWEHSYNTSESQFMATASWAASMLYNLTKDAKYARHAVDFMEEVLLAQRKTPLADADGLKGFFYRDKQQKVVVHSNHQSREQIYAQALVALLEGQPTHARQQAWQESLQSYGDYLTKIMKYTAPYAMAPAGVYHIDEAKDSLSFNRQHLFAGAKAKTDYVDQLKQGVKLDKEHYLKRFPVWFSFRGNAAIHLSHGKAATIVGKFLKNPDLLQIGREQLYWTVGKNPFGQSLIYGEGANFAQQYCPLPGEMVGEMPVGIQTRYNEDVPYWPQANNATYKEVWMTTAGKWLSLTAEF